MEYIKQQFIQRSATKISTIRDFVKKNADVVVDQVTLGQLYGGMRDVLSLVTETSLLDAQKGIEFRGKSIDDLYAIIKKSDLDSQEILPEYLLYLFLLDEIPNKEHINNLSKYLHEHSEVPQYVVDAIHRVSKGQPMVQFITAIAALQSDSLFTKAYLDGISKDQYWSYIYDDAMNLLAKLPRIVAYIYNYNYRDDKAVKESDDTLDYAGNLAYLLGDEDSDKHSIMKEFMRLYVSLHSDHEGGNGSAFTCHVAGSTLANPYASFTAALCSLSGPLHGLACQTSLDWIKKLFNTYQAAPNKQQIHDYIHDGLNRGLVVPGYGHAVLRKTDPRFTAQMNFAKKYDLHSDLIETVWRVYEVAPEILSSLGKIKNPYPNVDAHSGVLLNYFGFQHSEFYTVLFGLSRALGVMCQQIWDRATMNPIFRPKSITSDQIINYVKINKN